MKKKVQMTDAATVDAATPDLSRRTFVYLNEMQPLGYSFEELLDLGVSQKLTLSFVVAGRKIFSGYYHDNDNDSEVEGEDDGDGDGETEFIQAEGTFSGLVPLLQEYAWKILAEGKATVEYLLRTKAEFSRIEHSTIAPLPIVSRNSLLITIRDWQRFKDGLPAVPSIPIVGESKSKKSEILTIGALAYLYATSKAIANPTTYIKQNGDINIQKVTEDVVNSLSNSESHHPGAGEKSVQSLISNGLKTVIKIIKSQTQIGKK